MRYRNRMPRASHGCERNPKAHELERSLVHGSDCKCAVDFERKSDLYIS